MKNDLSSAFPFRPEAMLPAWLVTDGSLIVRNWNDITSDLLERLGGVNLLGDHSLSIDFFQPGNNGIRSLWEYLLDPGYLHYVEEALRILKRHIFLLEGFNRGDSFRPVEPLLNQLRQAGNYEGITTQVHRPKGQMFRVGLRVSPPQGLKLIMTADIEGATVEYVDIVVAYQLTVDWSQGEELLRKVFFDGTQPAIHDASERHRLWEKGEREKRAQITTFLSHAFQTPISNIKSMAGELRKAPLTDYYRKRFEKLAVHIDDLGHLSELIVFISASDKIPTIVCKSVPVSVNVWERVTVDEIKDEVLKTLQSVMGGRTRDRRNERKIEILAEMNGSSRAIAVQAEPATSCERAGDAILQLRGIEPTDSFGLLLAAEDSADLARRVKTTFLNLLLVELLLNAIKSADAQAPNVKLVVETNESKDRLNISIINNGLVLKESEFNNTDELAEKPGEKRKALGHKLNKIAADKLDWKLEWREPSQPGTHLTLSIPYRE